MNDFSKMAARPVIKPPVSTLDLTIETISVILLALNLIITIVGHYKLPQLSPLHFQQVNGLENLNGQPSLWISWSISLFLFVTLSILNKYPWYFNYPVFITPENAERQYILAKRLIRCIKALLMLVTLYLQIKIINTPDANHASLGLFFSIAIPLVLFIPVAIYVHLSKKLN